MTTLQECGCESCELVTDSCQHFKARVVEDYRPPVRCRRLIDAGMPDALSAIDALRLATLGGAEALGLADRVGSLETGKDADIAVFPINRIETIPEFEPEALLVHALAGAVQASHVMVAGRTLVSDGAIVGPVDGLYDRVKAPGARLAKWRVR